MAKLCVVSENKAKFKVFKVDRDYKADLLVFIVDRDYKANGDALWYMVDRDYKAKWNKPHKYQNMLWFKLTSL